MKSLELDILDKIDNAQKKLLLENEIKFDKNNLYIYSTKGKIGDIVHGIIANKKTRLNCFDYKQQNENIPHFEKTLIFINTNNIGYENWQKICIMENSIDFKDNIQKLLTSLWQESNLQNDIFELNIRAILKNYKDDFFSYFINKKEKNIHKITEIKIHYDIANYGAGIIKKAMQSINATEFEKNFVNKNGLELIDKEEIAKHIKPIENGINGKTLIKGVKMNKAKTEILHDSSKSEKIEKIETIEFSVDYIDRDTLMKLTKTLYGK